MSTNDKNLIELLRNYMEDNPPAGGHAEHTDQLEQRRKNQSAKPARNRGFDIRSGTELLGSGVPGARFQRSDYGGHAPRLGIAFGTGQGARLHERSRISGRLCCRDSRPRSRSRFGRYAVLNRPYPDSVAEFRLRISPGSQKEMRSFLFPEKGEK